MRRFLVLVALCVFVLAVATSVSAADVTAGKTVYERSCMACHGPNGVGASGPSLNTQRIFQRIDTSAKLSAIVRRGQPGMPAFSAEVLKDTDVDNLWAYIASLVPGVSAAPATAPAVAATPTTVASAPQPVIAPAQSSTSAPALPLEQLYALAVLALAAINGIVMVVLWKVVNRTPRA